MLERKGGGMSPYVTIWHESHVLRVVLCERLALEPYNFESRMIDLTGFALYVPDVGSIQPWVGCYREYDWHVLPGAVLSTSSRRAMRSVSSRRSDRRVILRLLHFVHAYT